MASESGQETQQAIRVHEFGPESVLKLETVPVPEPGDNEVLVKVLAAGINPVDTYIRAGTYARKPALPYTPGADAAGVVVRAGAAAAERFKAGDRVWLSGTRTGAYAQFCVAEAGQVVALPARLSFAQGAAINVPYATAYRALFLRGGARPGETVLVHGASGGVGVAAVQLATAQGLRVLGTAGTAEGLELVREQGAAGAFDHTKEGYLEEVRAATGGRGVDLVLEMLADKNLAADVGVLAKGGRIMVIGSRGSVDFLPRGLMALEADVRGVALAHTTPEDRRLIDAALSAGFFNGTLSPVADASAPLPLEQAPRAHHDVLNTRRLGKLVLEPWAPGSSL